MNTNSKLTDVSAELEREYGKPGTAEREQFDEAAYAFYTGQLLLQARKQSKMTQSELAFRTHTTKSYISRVEHGLIQPSVAMFHKLIHALGLRMEIRR